MRLTANEVRVLKALRRFKSSRLRQNKSPSYVGLLLFNRGDDLLLSAAMVPGITVVARPVEDLGQLAVTELVSAIEGKPNHRQIVLPAHLIKRGSVAKLK